MKANSPRIGIDIMGGDTPPEVLLDSLASLSLPLLAIGPSAFADRSPIPYYIAEQTISHDEAPLTAIRRKPDASLLVGLKLVREGTIDGLVSCGNTGALASGAKMILGMIPGLLRPALTALVPTKRDPIAVLDLGANVPCKAQHLVQFAKLGAAFQRLRNIPSPRVGLLNIGTEALKGTLDMQSAYQELKTLQGPHFQFAGNIEAKFAFDGHVDVLVTDGFTGNVFLKTAEGIANLILERLSEIGEPLSDLRRHLHYAQSPGALLLGVKGLVVKCHGYATPEAVVHAVREAQTLARQNATALFPTLL